MMKSQRPIHARRLPSSGNWRGFTLIELIVVISIIVLVLAVILPVVNTLNAGRSLQNAQNQVGGYIATVRADAIHFQQPMGVVFYLDPVNQQTTLAEVQQATLAGGTAGGVNSTNWNFNFSNVPLDIAGSITYSNGTTFQGTVSPYREFLTLSKTIGVALYSSPVAVQPYITPYDGTTGYSDTTGSSGFTNPKTAVDRLVRMGVIMFDEKGSLLSINWGVPGQASVPIPNSLYPKLLPGGNPAYLENSQLISANGFYLYDRAQFLAKTAASGTQFTDGDLDYKPDWNNAYPAAVDKVEEETWIFANGISLTVNPFDGTLLKAK